VEHACSSRPNQSDNLAHHRGRDRDTPQARTWGLLESAYHACLLYELRLAGLKVTSKLKIPVVYRGILMDCSYELDLLINDTVIVEIKCAGIVLPVHEAQLMTPLKLANKPVGLPLNFNVAVMNDGITRKLNRQALDA
jgi:GxxExxY protein